MLLDLSTAFDTVNHEYLLNHIKYRFGVDGTVLAWLTDYLTDQIQRVVLNGEQGQVRSDSVTPQMWSTKRISPWTDPFHTIRIPLRGYLEETWH